MCAATVVVVDRSTVAPASSPLCGSSLEETMLSVAFRKSRMIGCSRPVGYAGLRKIHPC